MVLGRKVSPEVAERHAADKKLAAELHDRLAAAQDAEREFHAAQVEGRALDELRPLAVAYDRALYDALLAAEAAQRSAMGPKTYEHGDAKQRRAAQIAARKAQAKPGVRPYADEVDRLRTLREAHKLAVRTTPPAHV
jgi:hypothetical protein